jgi:hypothetical protein
MLSNRPISTVSGLIFFFAVATAATAQPRADLDSRDGACFYQDPNYRGNSFCVRAGEELSAVPRGMNDRVSSIRTFGRSEVTVYQDPSFRGTAGRFDGSAPDLRQMNWNDRISSLRVTGDGYGYRDRYGYRGGDDERGRYGRYDGDSSRMVRQAYRDALNRDPDAEGMQYYRSRIVDDGWSEAQVRQDLRRSNGYILSDRSDRSATYGTTRTRAEDVVRNAYRSVLGREPDPGSVGYVDRVMHDGWSQSDVERELRRSAEYRNRVR